MRVENGQLVLERQDCTCGDGTVAHAYDVDCPKCRGTGHRGRGRCRNCQGRGTLVVYDHDKRDVCDICKGNYKDFRPENLSSKVPAEIIDAIPLRVIRAPDRAMSWAEQHLGGTLGSLVDYGAHKKLTDEQIIEHERDYLRRYTQGYGIVRGKDDMRVCKEIVIVTGDQGYTKKAVYDE